MDILKITIIGKDLFKLVEQKMEEVGIKTVNSVNNGMLGNLTTLTIEAEIDEKDVIKTRRALMEAFAKDSARLMPMYVHDDWMRIFVMKPLRI